MADLFENPLGLDGFEFVEFCAPAPGVLDSASPASRGPASELNFFYRLSYLFRPRTNLVKYQNIYSVTDPAAPARPAIAVYILIYIYQCQ